MGPLLHAFLKLVKNRPNASSLLSLSLLASSSFFFAPAAASVQPPTSLPLPDGKRMRAKAAFSRNRAQAT